MGLSAIGAGLQASLQAYDRSAAAVSAAAADTSSDEVDASDGAADLTVAMVGSNLAALGVKVNIALIRTTDEMLGSLLDVLV